MIKSFFFIEYTRTEFYIDKENWEDVGEGMEEMLDDET
jgi:hypothetical protein